MQHNNFRAAIYTRISDDPKLTGLGVERQLEDCREHCQQRGWTVVLELSDNDISAYTGKPRPDYRRLIDAIKNGEIDKVVAYHTDRLHRRLRELVEYCDVVTATNVTTHTVKAGDIDLSTPSGIMIAQIKGAVDEAYVSEARLKNLRARVQIAERGGRHKSRRPYGWDEDGITVRESEAVIIREIIRRLTAGDSPTALAADLNRREIPTSLGKRWTAIGVRKCGQRASNAGLREHLGVIQETPGQWDAIITRDEWERLNLALEARHELRYKRGVGRKYLLTGFAVCGSCGARLSATVGGGNRKPAYRCHKTLSHDPSQHGCGKVSRHIAVLEHCVSEAILERLDGDGLRESLAEQSSDNGAITELLSKRRDVQRRLDKFINDYTDGKLELSPQQFNRGKQRIETEIAQVNDLLARLNSKPVLTGIEVGMRLTDWWASASIGERRNIVELLIDKVVVNPLPQHFKVVWYEIDGTRYKFDDSLIDIIWKC